METRVIKHIDAMYKHHRAWYLGGVLDYQALDVETMGKSWVMHRAAWRNATDKGRLIIEQSMKEYASEALDHRSNILATLQIATEDNRCLIYILKDPAVVSEAQDMITELLVANRGVWVIQNQKFDLHQLNQHWGISFKDAKTHDTMLCEVLINGSRDESSANLLTLCSKYDVPEECKKLEKFHPVQDWWHELDEDKVEYMSRDCFALIPIAKQQREIMVKDNLLRVRKLECTLTPRLIEMENTGVCIDREKVEQFTLKANEAMDRKRHDYEKVFAGIKVSEAAKILDRIKQHFGIAPMKEEYDKTLGAFVAKESADKYALLDAGLTDDPAVKAYTEMKELSYQLSMASKWLDLPDDTLYINFYQVATHYGGEDKDGGARSGRMSCSPQIQNWQNFMKQFCTAKPGWVLFSSDYEAIELRLIAEVAGEKYLTELFATGQKPHLIMFCQAFNADMEEAKADKKAKGRRYRIAKEINFGFPYGMGGPKFCTRVFRGTDGEIRLTEDEGWKFRSDYFKVYPDMKNYHQRQLAFAALNGYVVTQGGRRRYYNPADRPALDQQYVPFYSPFHGCWVGPHTGKVPVMWKGEVRYTVTCELANPDACYRAADWRWKNVGYNHPIQGTGADGMKASIIEVVDTFDPTVQRLFATVHDSLDGVCREDKVDETIRIIDRAMKRGMGTYLPNVGCEVEHSVGRCWAAPPENIAEDREGLWCRPSGDIDLDAWVQHEFQIEYKLEA